MGLNWVICVVYQIWTLGIIFLFFSVKELASLHDRHLNRPTLDDNVAEEHAIEIQTQEITQVI